MKFSRERVVTFVVSRQLTTSTRGFTTGSIPDTFKPWRRVGTAASDVPPCPLPCVLQVGGTVNVVPAMVGTSWRSGSPTLNCVPVLFTQAALAGEETSSTVRQRRIDMLTLTTRTPLITHLRLRSCHVYSEVQCRSLPPRPLGVRHLPCRFLRSPDGHQSYRRNRTCGHRSVK